MKGGGGLLGILGIKVLYRLLFLPRTFSHGCYHGCYRGCSVVAAVIAAVVGAVPTVALLLVFGKKYTIQVEKGRTGSEKYFLLFIVSREEAA